MRTFLCVVLALGLASVAFSARQLPGEEIFLSSDMVSSIRTGSQDVMRLWRSAQRSGGKEEEEQRAIFTVKFFVPPAEGQEFEDAWLEMEEAVEKEDDQKLIFDLKKTKLDNSLYFAYGEWKSMKGVHAHFLSEEFEKFSDFVDEHGVRWELRLLKSLSPDLDKEEEGRHPQKGDNKKKGLAHVLFQYFVPPGEQEGFVKQWTETAEKTIKEEGNRIYSLRKVVANNVELWGYGTWESIEDYMEHFETKHLGALVDYTDEKNIVWIIHPLKKIGRQDE